MSPASKAAGSIQSFGGGNNAPTETLRSKAPQRQVAILAGVIMQAYHTLLRFK